MPTGKTKDAGWQIGVSATVEHPIAEVWDLLTAPAGLAAWLGSCVPFDGANGETYRTSDGTSGELRSLHHQDRVRLTWQPPDWDHDTTVQIAVVAKGDQRTSVRFHQERLANADEREQQRRHWKQIADQLTNVLDER